MLSISYYFTFKKFDNVLIDSLTRWRIPLTLLKRFGIGMVMASLAFLYAGIMEIESLFEIIFFKILLLFQPVIWNFCDLNAFQQCRFFGSLSLETCGRW